MAQRHYRASLNAPTFPLLSENFGRTVIAPTREEPQEAYSQPQVYYCHNVLPTTEGYEAVGYAKHLINRTSTSFSFYAVPRRVVTEEGDTVVCAVTYSTAALVYAKPKLPFDLPGWILVSDVDSISDKATFAQVRGLTYIFSPATPHRLYTLTGSPWTSLSAVNHTMAGLTMGDLVGITSAQGYLIAYTKTAVAWSSLLDPTDFVPSLVTGAGGGNVEAARGDILYAASISTGFLIYCEHNIVAATYTGNPRQPFKFREVEDSARLKYPVGAAGIREIATDTTSAHHYVLTLGGVVAVNTQRAEHILPEVQDFMSNGKLEYFDEATNEFVIYDSTTTIATGKLQLVASRFLVIGWADVHLVWDLELKRMGKLRLPITSGVCFDFGGLLASGNDNTFADKQALAFLQSDGDVFTVVTSATSFKGDYPSSFIPPSGVLLLGKYQYSRSHRTTIQELTLENIEEADTVEVYDIYSQDGKNTSKKEGYLAYSANKVRKYFFHTDALEHSILIKGAFKLVSAVFSFTTGGRR